MMKKVLMVAACGMLCSLGVNDVDALGKNNKQTIALSQNSDIASCAAFCRETFEQIEKILTRNEHKTLKTSLNIIKSCTKAFQALEDQKKEENIKKLFDKFSSLPTDVVQIQDVRNHYIAMLETLGRRRISQMMTIESKIDELCASLGTAPGMEAAVQKYMAARRVSAQGSAINQQVYQPVQQPVQQPVRAAF